MELKSCYTYEDFIYHFENQKPYLNKSDWTDKQYIDFLEVLRNYSHNLGIYLCYDDNDLRRPQVIFESSLKFICEKIEEYSNYGLDLTSEYDSEHAWYCCGMIGEPWKVIQSYDGCYVKAGFRGWFTYEQAIKWCNYLNQYNSSYTPKPIEENKPVINISNNFLNLNLLSKEDALQKIEEFYREPSWKENFIKNCNDKKAIEESLISFAKELVLFHEKTYCSSREICEFLISKGFSDEDIKL